MKGKRDTEAPLAPEDVRKILAIAANGQGALAANCRGGGGEEGVAAEVIVQVRASCEMSA